MTTKKCIGCGSDKSLDLFRKDKRVKDGRTSRCKKCLNADGKKAYESSPDRRARVKASALEWAKNNTEARAVIAKRRNQKAYKADPRKIIARSAINQKIRFGRMPKASERKCWECGNQASEYHHYEGYEPKSVYKVVPLCRGCHDLEHKRII